MTLIKTLIVTLWMPAMVFAAGPNYECKKVEVNELPAQVCFPENHRCVDAHGIGDGVAIPTDCWEGGSRACHNGSKNWPGCNQGVIATECKLVELKTGLAKVCFPAGHVCMDPHGIGNGVPIQTDCWEGGSRACNSNRPNWPKCAGGTVTEAVVDRCTPDTLGALCKKSEDKMGTCVWKRMHFYPSCD